MDAGKKGRSKTEKLIKLFESLGKKGTPYDPEKIEENCWKETEEEYQKKQKEWLKNRKK